MVSMSGGGGGKVRKRSEAQKSGMKSQEWVPPAWVKFVDPGRGVAPDAGQHRLGCNLGPAGTEKPWGTARHPRMLMTTVCSRGSTTLRPVIHWLTSTASSNSTVERPLPVCIHPTAARKPYPPTPQASASKSSTISLQQSSKLHPIHPPNTWHPSASDRPWHAVADSRQPQCSPQSGIPAGAGP